MSNYSIVLSKKAQKQLDKFSDSIAFPILEQIAQLEINPRPEGVKKLKGSSDAYRIRIGNYRVIYEIVDNLLIIDVITIAHRKDVYENY